jgi:hypothetical protein
MGKDLTGVAQEPGELPLSIEAKGQHCPLKTITAKKCAAGNVACRTLAQKVLLIIPNKCT